MRGLSLGASAGVTASGGLALRRRARVAAIAVVSVMCAASAFAQLNMPDPSLIAGRALPGPELPDGTVSVRVVREAIGNNITGQKVTVTAGGVTKTAATDDGGRAQMTGLPVGSQATAHTTVDGEELTSQPFEVPGKGGIRIILISGLKAAAERKAKEQAAEAAAPAVKGTVTFGGDSRVMLEFNDDELRVFYLLYITNTARTKVDVGGPLVIDLPTEAQSAAVLEGSSPAASARGNRVIVTGPFPAGVTPVQIAFGLPTDSNTMTLVQKWPAAMEQVLVMAQKVAGLKMASPQFGEHDEATAQNGTPYLLGGGKGLPAGGTLSVELSGIPVHPTWPRNVAMALAVVILVVGGWFAFSASGSDADVRRRLEEKRESMLGELQKLEEQRRAGRVDGSKYAARRQRLMAELERVYGELDGTGRAGGGEAAA